MSLAIDRADAVTAELNAAEAGSVNVAFTARRAVLPVFELAELSDLHVTVVPQAIEMTPATRTLVQQDVQIDIGVQKKLGKDLDGEIEPLMKLVEQIADHLRWNPLQNAMDAAWVRAANEPIYSPDHLAEQRLFTSVLTVTYRVLK